MASKLLYLDENLWTEILKRLPAKELGRIRCLCKSLNSLISSSIFISKHLSFLINTNPNPITYFLFDFSSIYSHVVKFSLYSPGQLKPPTFLPLPFTNSDGRTYYNYKQLGLINGVACVSRDTNQNHPSNTAVQWNPTINKHVAIPDSPHATWVFIGFGFDAITNDFKVVRYLHDKSRPPKFEVFSTKSVQWTSLDSNHILKDIPFFISTCGVCFINGSIHWVIRGSDGFAAILAFDCEKEEFRTMEFPVEARRRYANRIFVDDGVLAVRVLAFGETSGEYVVWMMCEHRIVDSWSEVATWLSRDYVAIESDGLLFEEPSGSVRRFDYGLIERSRKPVNGYVFEPSLFLLDHAN